MAYAPFSLTSDEIAEASYTVADAMLRARGGGQKMTDRELLELAAKAADITYDKYDGEFWIPKDAELQRQWDPLANDGDALRLVVKLGLSLDAMDAVTYARWFVLGEPLRRCTWEHHEGDPCAATRRTIVRAAAEIGKAME